MKKLLLFIPLLFLLFLREGKQLTKIEKFNSPVKEELLISSSQGLRDVIRLKDGTVISSENYHNAIDIVCKKGTKIYASKSGIVTSVYPSIDNGEKWKGHPIYGGLIEIQHYDGTSTRYAHLSKTLVNEGSKVKQGDLIGLSGGEPGQRGSGISTGPHLHFEIILDIEYFLDKF